MFGLEINHLANLLKDCDPNRADSDSDDDQAKKPTSAHLTPASVIPPTQKIDRTPDDTTVTKAKKAQPTTSKDIWHIDEVPERGATVSDLVDKRPEPEYEMHYKQRVTTEDLFLQMSNKNTSSASCEDLVVNIQLPDTKLTDIILDITKSSLDCRCPNYRFTLALPHPVDSDHSQAKWDKEKCQLQVTLRLDREYDDFNS